MKRSNANLITQNVVFVVRLIVANVVTSKVLDAGIHIGGVPILIPGAALTYAMTFLCTDVIGEIWGKKEANKAVIRGFAARLQLQERLARDIVQMLSEALNNEALGFAIVMKGQHLCKTMRGVRNDGKMSVAHFTGVFNLNSDLRKEFYKLIDLNSNG